MQKNRRIVFVMRKFTHSLLYPRTSQLKYLQLNCPIRSVGGGANVSTVFLQMMMMMMMIPKNMFFKQIFA
jgi:hypothetical protein